MIEGQQANYSSTLVHSFDGFIPLCVREHHKLVRVMANFWLSCALAASRTPFAMTYYNWLQPAENRPINIGACRNDYDVTSCQRRQHYGRIIAALKENSFLQYCYQLDNPAKTRCQERHTYIGRY